MKTSSELTEVPVLCLRNKDKQQTLSELLSIQSEWVLVTEPNAILDKDCLEVLYKNKDDSDIIYTWYRTNPEGKTTNRSSSSGRTTNRLFNAKALTRYNYIPFTALARRETLVSLGGIETNNTWITWVAALRAGARFKCVPEVKWTLDVSIEVG